MSSMVLDSSGDRILGSGPVHTVIGGLLFIIFSFPLAQRVDKILFLCNTGITHTDKASLTKTEYLTEALR